MPELIVLLVLVATFYLLVVRPQRVRLQAAKELRAGLGVGDSVMTTSGLYGVITGIEGDVLTLEVASGVRVRWAVGAIASVLEPAAVSTADQRPPAA